MCELVLRETRLLPHANPGLLSANWIERLRESNPSLGLMLESTSTRLPQAHPPEQTPDKLPALRLKTIEDAGRLGVPFTTGILIGIGETMQRPRRVAAGHQAAAPAVRTHSGSHHPEFPREAAASPWRRGPSPTPATCCAPSPSRACCCGDMNIQAPPNLTRERIRAAARRRHQRLGRGLAADARLHQSRSALAAPAGFAAPHRGRRTDAEAAPAGVSRVRTVRRRARRIAGREAASCDG